LPAVVAETADENYDFLITHEARPIDLGQARQQAPVAGKTQKDIILLTIVIACGYFDCPLGIA
jgi:hypothetical protein